LFENFPDVLDHYQNRYKYIMVDEYQDTNTAQFQLIRLLADGYKNLCVVGDDDQSIYKFRGANIRNILDFEKYYPEAKVIRLEQNYRSTQNILNCANELIKHNSARKGKNLWTSSGDGDKVVFYKAADEKNEAKFIADQILDDVGNGGKYNDHAVLYRINAMSNGIERALMQSGIPYKIFGGMKFYDRKEIRDVLAYLQVINNNADMLRLKRIINEPKRGIGDATVALLEQISSDLGDDPVSVMRNSADLAPIEKRSKQLTALADMFTQLGEFAQTNTLEELLDELLDVSGYGEYLQTQGDEGIARLENIAELKSTMAQYEEEDPEPSLSGFLEQISLFTDIDTLDQNADYVALMTMHAAKGLEFPIVFVVGMEENIFPSARSMESDEDIEEERRLAYVAMTRAKTKLYLTRACERMLYGHTDRNRKSRFLKEIPREYVEKKEQEGLSQAVSSSSNAFGEVGSIRSMSLRQQLNMRKTEKPSAETQSFSAGDRIKHKIFGEGTILSATPMANDTLLEIAFDTKGTKKIMANYAKVQKI
ncbi:MAG: UvrD-helicase domain-containing protein, partial [Ruminococcus sp.]|nr:UvrD-helicase domain-containing protein [Ruminococcus sp.]